MSLILVTGANGFVAQHLVPVLIAAGHQVRLTTQNQTTLQSAQQKYPLVQGIVSMTDCEGNLESILAGVDCIIHLAARVHVMNEDSLDPIAEFTKANVITTVNLANAAVKAKVRRFIYVSTIKVNGEFTLPGQVFTERDLANPRDPYSQSKWQAEQALRDIATSSQLEIVILRPPLIFGPGVSANFLRLMQWIKRGIPLPFGGIHNERSLLYVENFADALLKMIDEAKVVGKTYVIADQPALSTPELIRELASATGSKARAFKVPISLLKAISRFTHQSSIVDRLTQSLLIDPHQLYRDLGWKPPVCLSEAISRTVLL